MKISSGMFGFEVGVGKTPDGGISGDQNMAHALKKD
jgi:hypothetical protein